MGTDELRILLPRPFLAYPRPTNPLDTQQRFSNNRSILQLLRILSENVWKRVVERAHIQFPGSTWNSTQPSVILARAVGGGSDASGLC